MQVHAATPSQIHVEVIMSILGPRATRHELGESDAIHEAPGGALACMCGQPLAVRS